MFLLFPRYQQGWSIISSEHIKQGTVKIVHVSSDLQKADLFMKGLTVPKFQTMRKLLMGWYGSWLSSAEPKFEGVLCKSGFLFDLWVLGVLGNSHLHSNDGVKEKCAAHADSVSCSEPPDCFWSSLFYFVIECDWKASTISTTKKPDLSVLRLAWQLSLSMNYVTE